MAEGGENVANVGELADLFDAGGDAEDAHSNITEAELDALSDVDELRNIAKSLLRQRNEVMDLIGAARKNGSGGDLASELGLREMASALSEVLMLDTPASGSAAPQKPRDANALHQKDGSEMLPDLDSIGESMVGMSNAFSEAFMLDVPVSSQKTADQKSGQAQVNVASLPDFEDIADSAADLADTVSNFGSLLSEAFMMDSGSSSSSSSSAKEVFRGKVRQFYIQHNPTKMQAPDSEKWLAGVVDFYASKPAELNQRLKEQYGVDLTSVSATSTSAQPPTPAVTATGAAAGATAGAAVGAGGAAAAGSIEDEVDALLGEDDGLAVVDLN
jgi:hypothetical protein